MFYIPGKGIGDKRNKVLRYGAVRLCAAVPFFGFYIWWKTLPDTMGIF